MVDIYKLQSDIDSLKAAVDKAQNSWSNWLFYLTMKLTSLLVLLAAIYCAIIGAAGGAFVMALLFSVFWAFYAIAMVASKAYIKNIETEFEKYKAYQNRVGRDANVKPH